MDKNVIGTIYLTTEQYDWYGQDVGWDTNIIYRDEMSMPFDYFYSPDGVGRVWVNTLQELHESVFLETAKILVVRKKR